MCKLALGLVVSIPTSLLVESTVNVSPALILPKASTTAAPAPAPSV